jgi:hypothetical protein
MLVEGLDEKARKKFDNDLYTPPEYRTVLTRVNQGRVG